MCLQGNLKISLYETYIYKVVYIKQRYICGYCDSKIVINELIKWAYFSLYIFKLWNSYD